ncbi:unnamed protein product [Prorocentrum cordatum]|uniref:Uncharacterized protein n=1 Tax=Prorocentrum cordatum TaxID=2364126 RepID=A0ABN9T0P8_9DINO|nr:unnamed protein product [Polarella glacialis]
MEGNPACSCSHAQSFCTCVDSLSVALLPRDTDFPLPWLALPPPKFCAVMSSSTNAPTCSVWPFRQLGPSHQVQSQRRTFHFKSPMLTSHDSLDIPTVPDWP